MKKGVAKMGVVGVERGGVKKWGCLIGRGWDGYGRGLKKEAELKEARLMYAGAWPGWGGAPPPSFILLKKEADFGLVKISPSIG